MRIIPRCFVFRYRSAQHWLEVFRNYYGPTLKAFEALDADKQDSLVQDILALLMANHTGGPGLAVPSAYNEVILTRG